MLIKLIFHFLLFQFHNFRRILFYYQLIIVCQAYHKSNIEISIHQNKNGSSDDLCKLITYVKINMYATRISPLKEQNILLLAKTECKFYDCRSI
jgi:hypothetical protein